MSRVTRSELLRLDGLLSDRERELVRTVDRLGLVDHSQLAALDPPTSATRVSQARAIRRRLARLCDREVLGRLERRIGGERAGSAGFVFYVGPVGQRLLAYWNGDGLVRGRRRPEPGGRYVRHRLAVSQLYVDVQTAARGGELDVLDFEIEPDCWRTSLDGFGGSTILKPDAYLRIGVGAYEDRFLVEVDLGTESRPVLARKLRAYLDYFHSGTEQAAHSVFPRILLLANSESRKTSIVDLCTRLPAEQWHLFAVGQLEDFTHLITGGISDDAHDQVGVPS